MRGRAPSSSWTKSASLPTFGSMHAFESHRQWPAVSQVCATLKAAGFQAWLAGGCVRDLLMNRDPNDFDIATDARPEQVETLFPRALTVGREFGVTILPFDGFHVEVATFRQDGPYIDGRRPANIAFSTPEEDAKRRDFTVNALYFDIDKRQVIDFVGGEADIRARLLRAVGDPDRRFDEDKLRILRAVRFAAQLDFTIEAETLVAVRRRASQVKGVSAERIRDEVLKLMKSPNASRGLRLLRETQLWEVVFPELTMSDRSAAEDEAFRSLERRAAGGADSPELAALILLIDFVDAMAPDVSDGLVRARAFLKRLRFSNSEADTVLWSLRMKDLFRYPSRSSRAAVARALGHHAASVAESVFTRESARDAGRAALFAEIRSQILVNGGRELPERFVSGDDLLAMGMSKGPELGRTLEEVFDRQLEGSLTSREMALDWAKMRIAKRTPGQPN